MTAAATVTLRLPPAFYHDHKSRELPSGTVIRETSKYVEVALDADAYRDLLDDARFYSEQPPGTFDPDLFGLIRSAAATVKKLAAVDAPAGAQETKTWDEVADECSNIGRLTDVYDRGSMPREVYRRRRDELLAAAEGMGS